MLVPLLAVILVLAGCGLAVRLYMDRAAEDRLEPNEHVVIRELRDPIPGNAFLACPAGYCTATAAPSPIFAFPVARLIDIWNQMLAKQPNIAIVADETAQQRMAVIQHTPLLRFPDIITVEFAAPAPDRSSLAIYSRARYGRGDFGTNRKRVLAWLSRIEQLAGQ
jgi:uncharacterized protein (DUF1499 family)